MIKTLITCLLILTPLSASAECIKIHQGYACYDKDKECTTVWIDGEGFLLNTCESKLI